MSTDTTAAQASRARIENALAGVYAAIEQLDSLPRREAVRQVTEAREIIRKMRALDEARAGR